MIRRTPLLLALVLACTAPPPPPEPTPAPAAPPSPPVTVLVTADFTGASLSVIERELTDPLERAFTGLDGLGDTRSTTRRDRAELRLGFAPGTDAIAAVQAVRSRLQSVEATLPSDATTDIGLAHDSNTAVLFTLRSASAPPEELSRAADTLHRALLGVPDVVAVELCGRRTRRLEVSLDPQRLPAYALTVHAIADALRADLDDLSLGAGARMAPVARTPEELGDLVVAAREAPIRLRDVASITLALPIDRCAAVRLGAGQAIVAVVHARRGAASDIFNNSVRAAIDARRPELPREIDLDVPALALRAVLDLETPGDPESALATNAETISKLLAEAKLQPVAYLQAPIPAMTGERHTGDLILLPASPDEAAALRDALPRLPGLALATIGSPADPTADPLRHRVRVTGPDLEVSARIADELAALLRAVPGVVRVHHRDSHNPELELLIRRTRLAELGLRVTDVQTTLAVGMDGLRVGAVPDGEGKTPVVLRLFNLPLDDRITRLQSLLVQSTPTAPPVQLDTLVEVRRSTTPREILHHDRQRTVPVDYFTGDPATLDAARDRVARDLQLPAGVALVWE